VISWGIVRGQFSDLQSQAVVIPDLETSQDFADYTEHNLSLGITDLYYQIVPEVPSRVPYQLGGVSVGALIDLIPRAIWTSKPLSAGNFFMTTFYPDMLLGNTIGPGLFGYLFMDGGIFAIVIGCAIFGWLSRGMYIAALRTSGRGSVGLFYALAFAAVPNAMQGGLQAIVVWLLTAGMPVIAILMASGSPSDRVTARAKAVGMRRIVGGGPAR